MMAVNAAASQPSSSIFTRAACCTCVTAAGSSKSASGEKSARVSSNASVTPSILSVSVSSRSELTSNFGTLQTSFAVCARSLSYTSVKRSVSAASPRSSGVSAVPSSGSRKIMRSPPRKESCATV